MPVTAVSQTQRVEADGSLHDQLEITFTLADRTGSFTVTVDQAGDPVANAAAAIDALRNAVAGIYAIAV